MDLSQPCRIRRGISFRVKKQVQRPEFGKKDGFFKNRNKVSATGRLGGGKGYEIRREAWAGETMQGLIGHGKTFGYDPGVNGD